jgi:hypothetical protein
VSASPEQEANRCTEDRDNVSAFDVKQGPVASTWLTDKTESSPHLIVDLRTVTFGVQYKESKKQTNRFFAQLN